MDCEYLSATLTDAIGHSTIAATLATLTVGSLRNTRRAIASPRDQASAAGCCWSQATPTGSSPALLLGIGLADGAAELVNAGRPPPFLLRKGEQ